MAAELNTQIDDVLATFAKRRANIEARHVPVGNYVLRWDNGLMVYVNPETKEGSATGFENASFFGDREAASAYGRATLIRNGRDERPVPVLAFNAKQGALVELDGVIADLSSRKEA